MAFFDNLKGTWGSATQDVVNKINVTTEISKIKMKIKNNDSAMNQLKMQLGSEIYAQWDGKEETEYAELLLKIRALEDENKECQNDIIKIQEEVERQKEEKIIKKEELKRQEELRRSEENTISCPNCGEKNEKSSIFCVGCGINLKDMEKQNKANDESEEIVDDTVEAQAEQTVKTCPICGNVLDENDVFCIKCGTKIKE